MSTLQITNAATEGEASKTGMSLDEKIGMAKKFDREMKDYAKATVKEFLGIYGYEEDVDINIDESETQKANETSQPDEKCTETESSTTADCDSLGCKTHLETPGTCEARVVVMIETDDANEVSEISNVESTSRAKNRSSNPDLPSNEKLPCLTKTLATEIVTSDIEERCKKIGKQQELQDVFGSEKESHSEMCGLQWTPCQTLGETLVSQDRLGTLGDAVDCGTSEQSTKTVEEVNRFDNEVLISQNTERIQNETLEQHANSVSSFERLEITASEETALTSVQAALEELDRTAATLVDDTLEVPQALSIPTPSEILDAISQIIPHSEPVVLKEHSYASVESNSSRILQDALSSDIRAVRLPVHFCSSPILLDNSCDFCASSNKKTLNNSKSALGLHSTTSSDTLQPQSSCDSSLEAGQYKTQSILLKDSSGSKEKKRLSTKKERKNETAEKRGKRLNLQREQTRSRFVSKPAVIPISEDTNIVAVLEDANAVPISEDTNTVSCQRPKMMQDPVSTNTLVSSESGNVIDGQQLSQSGKGYHRVEICDMHRASPVTSDIPPSSDSSVLQKDDRDVIQDNSNDLAVPENGEDLHKKIDVLNNQILSGLTESAQTMPGLSASQEDKDTPDHVDSSVIETSLVGSKLCLTERDLHLPRVVPGQGEVIGETQLDGSTLEQDSAERTLKQKNCERIRRRRAMETPEQRETRLKQQRERVRERRANETDLQRETRRDRDRIRKQIKRTSESAESRSKRLLQHRDAMRRKRALESPEEKQMRQLKDKDRAKRSRESKRAGVVMEWWKK